MAVKSIAMPCLGNTVLPKCRICGLLIAALLALGGCENGTLPDPNDPKDVGLMRPDEVQRNLKATSDFLNERRLRGEISDERGKELIAKRADELLKDIDLSQITAGDAWQYGEVFVTAKKWPAAKKVFELAVKKPANEDRRINDTLHLARVLAEMGEVSESISRVRSTFNCKIIDAAPILPAVLLEVVPAGLGKGHDVEYAQLLIDAIAQEQRVYVDPTLDQGKAFLMAKPFHIEHAYRLAIGTFLKSNRMDLASKARDEYLKWKGSITQA